MKIFVTAKPGAKAERVAQIDAHHFEVAVKEPPLQSRANAAIIKALAKHLGVSASALKIVSGWRSRLKIMSRFRHICTT